MTVTLPAYTPTRWELRLPDYPIITNSWRSSAFPEILGSLPNGSEWRLEFENMTSAEALALMLPWRATAGGQWALGFLPIELAGGCNSASFRKRLTGTTWSIASEPRKESVKNERFNISIDLIYELTFISTYGPTRPTLLDVSSGLRLRIAPINMGLLPTEQNILLYGLNDFLETLGEPSSLQMSLPNVIIYAQGQGGVILLPPEGALEFEEPTPSLELNVPTINMF